MDARQAERLARVDRDVAGLAAEVLERVEVARGREAGLGAGDVEADDAPVAVLHDELGDLARARGGAHRGEQRAHADLVAGLGRGGLAVPEAVEHRLDDLVEGEAAGHVQLGGEPDLGVDHAVGGEVLGALGGHPDDRVAGLHDADRVGEGLEVALQRPGVGRLDEPAAELVGVGRREAVVAGLLGELDDRRRSQAAVEVVVQQHLGRPAYDVLGQRGAPDRPRDRAGCSTGGRVRFQRSRRHGSVPSRPCAHPAQPRVGGADA